MTLIGVDEVGRGTWAGPIVAAAVMIDGNQFIIDGLTDSKKLNAAKRLSILRLINSEAVRVGIGWVSAQAIDSIGLLEANRLAMVKAFQQVSATGEYRLLVDGNIEYIPGCETVIGGDGIEPCISAASIIAKVMRDNYMHQLAKIYPSYGFDKHVGYGTSFHKKALELSGVIDGIHRKSFKPVAKIAGL